MISFFDSRVETVSPAFKSILIILASSCFLKLFACTSSVSLNFLPGSVMNGTCIILKICEILVFHPEMSDREVDPSKRQPNGIICLWAILSCSSHGLNI